MRTVKNLIENCIGRIECEILIKNNWYPHSMKADAEYTIHEESEWEGVKPCDQEDISQHQLETLKQSAVTAMRTTVELECKSGVGKLYFSDLNSAARHSVELLQPDAEIRERAIKLLKWDVAIDAYALSVVFSIEEGGEVPTIDEFIAGLPTL